MFVVTTTVTSCMQTLQDRTRRRPGRGEAGDVVVDVHHLEELGDEAAGREQHARPQDHMHADHVILGENVLMERFLSAVFMSTVASELALISYVNTADSTPPPTGFTCTLPQ